MAPPKKRKVTIIIKSRDDRDPLYLLQAVEVAFRPKEIDIIVCDPDKNEGKDDSEFFADEQLEQEMTDKASNRLDELDKQAKQEKSDKKDKADNIQKEGVTKNLEQAEAVDKMIEKKKKGFISWITGFVASGYKITIKAITETILDKHY